MSRPARARINLQALQHNFSLVQQAAPDTRVMAIIKANAYGHGLISIAQALPAAAAFGVSCLDEAIALREAGFDRRIVLLEGLFGPDDISLVCGYRLDVVVHHESQLQWLAQRQLLRPLDVWLKIDTGMHRLGFAPHSARDIVQRLQQIPQLATVRYMTHFPCADDLDNPDTDMQIETFNAAVAAVDGEHSLANSAAILGWPAARADWVRPGIMLYGSSPLGGRTAASLGLQPVMTLSTRLIAVNALKQGDAVGYGGDWHCPSDRYVGVAAIGYGDGYPRHAPTGTPLRVNGRAASLVGRVSMDMISIDLGNEPCAQVGDEVILWGEGLPIDEVAAAASTISYELLCNVGSRVQFSCSS
ncbi:MAG: alanine racemase [Gammaproteobacteria bacterium]|jgi:alanine racemase